MDSLLDRLVVRLVAVRRGETAVALLMFAYSFLAMTSHNILKPITRSKFITDLGAENLPYVQLMAGILIGVLMHLHSRAIRGVPQRYAIPITQSFIIVLMVILWGLLRTEAVWVTVALYFLSLILGVLLISQFWTLANDVYDARQAKRLFGFIGGGASLGGATGAALTAVLVDEVGSANLLLVSAAVLALCAAIVLRIGHRGGGRSGEVHDERGVGRREAIRLLTESRQLRVIALVIACAAAGATVIEQQLSMAAEATQVDEDSIAAFLARVIAYASLAGFVVQVALTSWIHRALGIGTALLLLPVGLGASGALILTTGALWAVAGARVLDSTLRYSLDKTTREVLYLPLSPELRHRAKPFIDVTMDRFAKAVAALLVLVLIQPWGLGLDWRRLSYASLTLVGLWVATALMARREYLASFRASIGAKTIAPELLRTDAADASTIETLVEELSNPDEGAVLYAIDMLEALDKPNLITPLLLHHDSPRVRARTLRALSPERSRTARHWVAGVERMVHDEDVDVRATALRALAALSQEDTGDMMRRHLDDAEPRVAVAAAAVLADSRHDADTLAAEETLTAMIGDRRDASVDLRKDVAAALAAIRAPRFRPLLVPLLDDSRVEVAQEAIRSARRMGMSDGLFLPALMSLLAHRALKSAAREALVGYGEDAIAALRHVLLDPHEFIWVRRHIPATLALMPAQASMDALVASLGDPDGFLRYKAIAAIERLRRDHPAIVFPRPVIEKLVVQETSRYYNYLTLQHNLSRHDVASRGSLLDRALDDKLARTLDRIYRLLGLLYNMDDVAAARFTIEQGEARRRAAAVEYLDNLLGGIVRKRVLPILEDTPIAEKARYANLVLKTRPRDLDDTLAQLVHDDDPVVAASAIHFAARQAIPALADDIEYVRTRRSRDDRVAIDAAVWAAGLRQGTEAAHGPDPLPAVEVADRVRGIPLFQYVSVDELFRIADVGREARHAPGQEIHHAGAAVDDVELLIEGSVQIGGPGVEPRTLHAPAVLGLEDALQGLPARLGVRAVDHVVCFRIRAAELMTMISDNVPIAQGLFRMLLLPSASAVPIVQPTVETPPADRSLAAWQPVDAALLLRHHPLLARATVAQLMALVTAARETPLTVGLVLCAGHEPAAMFLVLDGCVHLEADDAMPRTATGGASFGVAETLAGTPSRWRVTVTESGRALRLDREDFFAVLADHVDLMQSVFGGVLSSRAVVEAPPPVPLGPGSLDVLTG